LKVFVLLRCGYKKGNMTIAFIPSFHDVLPMCSVFQTCQTAAASSRVWLLWKLVISRFSFGTLSVWRSGLLVYNVVFIVGPNRLGTGSTWGRTGLGPDRTDTRILPTRCGNFSVCFRPSTRSDILLWNKLETPVKISTEFWTLEISEPQFSLLYRIWHTCRFFSTSGRFRFLVLLEIYMFIRMRQCRLERIWFLACRIHSRG
jgi:hypothetical protein